MLPKTGMYATEKRLGTGPNEYKPRGKALKPHGVIAGHYFQNWTVAKKYVFFSLGYCQKSNVFLFIFAYPMSLLIMYACVMDVTIGVSRTEVQGCPDDILLSMRR